jgi:mRNA-degrading endonuclease YafQ of YafQ-DinJ toxin-antitoxin module
MRQLVVAPKFRRAYRKLVRNDRTLQRRIEDILIQMGEDIFADSLGTHKLSGELTGLWACSCGYDCRIIFALETDDDTGREIILLLDIGTHDEVY